MIPIAVRAGLLALLSTAPLSLAEAAPQGLERWLLVRSEAEAVGSLSWERIGQVYLKTADFDLVEADAAEGEPTANRFVVGCPGDQPALERLFDALGIERDDASGDLGLPNGIAVPADDGLVISGPDPDGQGRLVLFTGGTPDAVFQGFTVPVDLRVDGFFQVRRGLLHGRGGLGPDSGLDRPLCVRVDRDWVRWLDETADWPTRDRQLRLAASLASHGAGVRNTFVGTGNLGDVDAWLQRVPQLVERSAQVLESTERLRGRDLASEVERAWQRMTAELGCNGPAPVVRLALDLPEATNARTLDLDPLHGRPQVVLNLAALTGSLEFEVALHHELAHCLDHIRGGRLMDRATREAVAMWISQAFVPKASEAQVLMWTSAELQGARRVEDALLETFRRFAGSTSPDVAAEWLTLGRSPRDVAGAPPRSGYFVAWRALANWRKQHPREGLRALLRLTPEALMATLP
jgi:hypothetical protein